MLNQVNFGDRSQIGEAINGATADKRRKMNQMARINEKIQNNTNFINGVSRQ